MLLLTGATGFLGGHLARLLATRGAELRLLVRPTSDRRRLEGISAEIVEGDLTDRASLDRACRGCRELYHVAADYRLWARDPSELERSNVEGTRNILAAAAEAGIKRVVYTSTVGAIGLPADTTPGDETTPVSLADMAGPYKKTKFLAEQEALAFARRGLHVVIVNPTAPVGEADWRPTPTGKIIVDFLRGAMPAYLDTGLNLVDAADVAEGHLLAAQRGVSGGRYILGARNLTLREILETLGRIAGRKPPSIRLPYRAAWVYGALSTAWANLSGRAPRAPLDAVRLAAKKMWVRSDKARRELGYDPSDPEEALRRAVAWFQTNKYC